MKTFAVLFVTLAVCCSANSVSAEGNAIRGTVIDAKGTPVAGAEIRAERTDAKAPATVVKTDAKGQYSLNHLALGTYKVTASVNKTPSSAATVKTSNAGWVKLDFPLKNRFARQSRDQSRIDRTEGQDIRRIWQNQ
jgi:hypothetical protein